MTSLNLTPLESAFTLYKIAYEAYQKKPSDLLIRDATIQRFEYTYELAVKMIKRQLEQSASVPADIDLMPFRDRIRYAAEKGIIEEPTLWFEFREMRNRTRHTYDNNQAEIITEISPHFLTAIFQLIVKLQRLNADSMHK